MSSLKNLLVASVATAAPLAAETSYIHPSPELCHLHDEPFPEIDDPDAVVGIYYNILFPEERSNQGKPVLLEWLRHPQKSFISLEEFSTLNEYALLNLPKTALSIGLAEDILHRVEQGSDIKTAMGEAMADLRYRAEGLRETMLPPIAALAAANPTSATEERCKVLTDAIKRALKKPEGAVAFILKLEERPPEEIQAFLESLVKNVEKHQVKDPLRKFEVRADVMEQGVNALLQKTPHSPCFLALNEVTPDALEDLKKKWPERHFQWISFNNISGKETAFVPPSEETVLGESAAFTSTIALSPELKMVGNPFLADLPSPSGSKRKIMAVQVVNTNNDRPFTIFLTHTDHATNPEVYSQTARKIHEFVQKFSGPWIEGGDHNVFEGCGGQGFYDELSTEGPFKGATDIRYTEFYAHRSVQNITFVDVGESPFSQMHQAADGSVTFTPDNALDMTFLQKCRVIAATRLPFVYNNEGKLLDPYIDEDEYNLHLSQRHTASDHLAQAVVFVPEKI